MLGGLGEDDDPVPAHVHEAAEYREDLLRAALLDAELSGSEAREQRRVVRQDPEVTLATGRDDHVHVVLVDLALRRDDLDVQRHQAFSLAILSAFSRASSIAPTM